MNDSLYYNSAISHTEQYQTRLQRYAEEKVKRSTKPIINMVFFGAWDWTFAKIQQEYIKHLSCEFDIIPSIMPIPNCDVYQYWRPACIKAQNFFEKTDPASPFFTKSIHMIHDSPYDTKRAQTEYRKLTIDRFHKILCTSQEQVEFYSNYVRDKSKLVYNPLAPLNNFTLSKSKRTRIGFVARIYPDKVKGEDLLLAIAKELNPSEFEFNILSPNGTALISQLKSMRFNVCARKQSGFDVLLITSRYEGTPLPLIEALSSHVPVLSTPVGEAPTLLSKENICHTKNDFLKRLETPSKINVDSYDRSWKDHINTTLDIWNLSQKIEVVNDPHIFGVLSWQNSATRYIEAILPIH